MFYSPFGYFPNKKERIPLCWSNGISLFVQFHAIIDIFYVKALQAADSPRLVFLILIYVREDFCAAKKFLTEVSVSANIFYRKGVDRKASGSPKLMGYKKATLL